MYRGAVWVCALLLLAVACKRSELANGPSQGIAAANVRPNLGVWAGVKSKVSAPPPLGTKPLSRPSRFSIPTPAGNTGTPPPDIGTVCAGKSFEIPVPPRWFEQARAPFYVLFVPCGTSVEATRHPTKNAVVVSVPELAESGPVWVVDSSYAPPDRFTKCRAIVENLNQLRSAIDACHFDPGLLTGTGFEGLSTRDFKQACRALGSDIAFHRGVLDALMHSCPIECPKIPPTGTLTVERRPEVRLSLDTAGEFKADAEVEAEYGSRHLQWRVWSAGASPPVSHLVMPGRPALTVPNTGEATLDVGDMDLTVRVWSQGRCGVSDVTLDVKPIAYVNLDGTFNPLDTAPTRIKLTTPVPLPQNITGTLTPDSSAFCIVSDGTAKPTPCHGAQEITIASGNIEAGATLSYDPSVGPGVAALTLATTPAKINDLEVRASTALPLLSGHYSTAPPGMIRATGVMHYSDPVYPGPGTSGERAVRNAYVELLDDTEHVVGVGYTKATGDFELFAPSGVRNLKLRVCAMGGGVHVDHQLNLTTPVCVDTASVVVQGPQVLFGSMTLDGIKVSEVFNAFDVMQGGLEYLALTNPSVPRGGVVVVPRPDEGIACAPLNAGPTTVIWVPWSRMRYDRTLTHELGHHVQKQIGGGNVHLNWGATHDGCYVLGSTRDGLPAEGTRCTLVGLEAQRFASLSQNDPTYAMFEGFPTAFADAALEYGNQIGGWTALPEASLTYGIYSCKCPLVGLLNCSAHIIDESAVEHYVAGVLMRVSEDWRDANLGFGSRSEAMGKIIEVIASVGQTQRPTYRKFRAEWWKRYPNYAFDGLNEPESGYHF